METGLRVKKLLLGIFVVITAVGQAQVMPDPSKQAALAEESKRIPVTFTGGHNTEGVDKGRPVILVASALNVPPEVFRKVFSGVKPAGPGEQPEEAQVRKNKQVLLEGLGPYGVTDERLNEVSNFYRYRRDSGELWKHGDAQGYFVLGENGQAGKIVITNPGYGYSSPPAVLVGGKKMNCEVRLNFSTDLEKNGSIKDAVVVFPPTVNDPASGKSQ